MANTSIGRLNVILSASASDFDKAINGAEKRLTGFAAKAATPLTSFAKFGTSVSNFTAPVETMMGSLSKAMAFVPGGGMLAASLGIAENFQTGRDMATQAMKDARQIARESERYAVSPGFYRAVKMAGGADGDLTSKLLDKVQDTIGALQKAGNPIEDALSPFVDTKKLAGSSTEEALKMIADGYANITDQATAATMASAVFGNKMADDAHYFLSGGRANLDNRLSKVRELGLDNSTVVGLGGSLSEIEKLTKLYQEQSGQRKAVMWGLWDKGWAEGDFGGILKGIGAVVTENTAGWFVSNKDAITQLGKHFPEVASRELRNDPATRAKTAAMQGQVAATQQAAAFNRELESMIKNFGMSAEAAKIAELAAKGATKAEIDKAEESMEILSARSKGQQLFDSALSPADKLASQFDDLANSMYRGGLEGQAAIGVINKLVGDANRLRGAGTSKGIGSSPILANSQEAARSPHQARAPSGEIKTVDELRRFFADAKSESQKSNKFLEDIYKELKTGKAKVITSP